MTTDANARHERRVGAGLAYLSVLLGIEGAAGFYNVFSGAWPTEAITLCALLVTIGVTSWAIVIALSALALLRARN